MIQVTQAEAEYIRKRIPGVKVIVTSRGKNARQKKRWAEESGDVFRVLRRLRNKDKDKKPYKKNYNTNNRNNYRKNGFVSDTNVGRKPSYNKKAGAGDGAKAKTK